MRGNEAAVVKNSAEDDEFSVPLLSKGNHE